MNVDHRALRGALQLGLTVALATALASAQSISQHNLDTKQYSPVRHTVHTEKQRYDGWYNNLAHQDWGAVESQLVRKAPSSYADGVYMIAGEDRPSPRILSQALMKGEDGLPSMRNLTVLFVFFGQMISSEVLMASEPGCPIEFHRIKINRCDEMYDKKCRGEKFMPFHRAIYDSKTGQSPNNPREQINMGTSWIDGSFVYSTSETWVNTMRSFKNGTFRTTEGKLPPRNRERVPLFNSPPARYLGIMNPERMFSKCQICQIAETELLSTWCLSMAAINWWTVLTPAVAIGRMFNSR